MKTHGLIGCSTVVAALLTGCSGMPQPDDGVVGETESAIKLRCPDPATDCTLSNGPGVYTDEDGYAGMGPQQLMITHFINNGSSVGFDGQVWTGVGAKFAPLTSPGYVGSADFNGATGYSVLSVSESNTVPTWTLLDANGNVVTVTSGALLKLTLHLVLPGSGVPTSVGSAPKAFAIWFNGGGFDSSGQVTVEKFNMMWRAEGSAANYQYCIDSDSLKDQVVFQQSIDVDPNTGAVTRDSKTTSHVTLSCRKGAIATVHTWGYAYKPGFKTFYFDAGINLKRAAYCGDARHWTKSGTLIRIADSSGINTDAIFKTEAYWGLGGALCVNMNERRQMPMPFSGICNGQPLPDCSTFPAASGYWLEDGAESLQP
jgi:ADYC domain-containing protein